MQQLIDSMIASAFVVLGSILISLLRRGIKAFEDRTGIDVPDELEAYLDAKTPLAISYAEEQAKKAIKAKLGALEGSEKMKLAIKFLEENKPKNLVLPTEKLPSRIEATKNLITPSYLTASLGEVEILKDTPENPSPVSDR